MDPHFLIRAYRAGIFPMALEDGEIGWFSPDPRGVIPLDGFRVPHGLRRLMRRDPFEIRFDTAFREVVEGCADRESTWIDEAVKEAYSRLFQLGFGHSVEAWQDGCLVGGLYGVAIGSAFFGESMFSRVSGASQVALVALVERLRQRGFLLLDTQWTTPHLERFGAVEIGRSEYLARLSRAVAVPNRFP